MTKKISMWAENMLPTLVSFYNQSLTIKEDLSSNEFMKHFDKLVEKYPIIKEGEKESIYIWLIILKMATLESHKYSHKKPKAFINEIERRILRLFPKIISK